MNRKLSESDRSLFTRLRTKGGRSCSGRSSSRRSEADPEPLSVRRAARLPVEPTASCYGETTRERGKSGRKKEFNFAEVRDHHFECFFPFLNQITIQDFVWFSVRLFHSYRYSVTEDYVQKTSLRLLLTRDPVNSGWKFPRWRWPWKCWRKKPASCSTRLWKGRLRSHGSLGSVKKRTQNLK